MKIKTPKPGQFCTINGVIYRAKNRIMGCRECVLNDPFLCPNVGYKGIEKPLKCDINNIILTKV